MGEYGSRGELSLDKGCMAGDVDSEGYEGAEGSRAGPTGGLDSDICAIENGSGCVELIRRLGNDRSPCSWLLLLVEVLVSVSSLERLPSAPVTQVLRGLLRLVPGIVPFCGAACLILKSSRYF